MTEFDNEKLSRILSIYTKLRNGDVVNKEQEAERYGVNERSIRRDIDEIRNYLSNNAEANDYIELVYDGKVKGYRFKAKDKFKLDGAETLAICKILLDSRSLSKSAMTELVGKVIDQCYPNEKAVVKDMVKNEMFHYVQPQHDDKFLPNMWGIANAIKQNRYIDIEYSRSDTGKNVKRHLMPLAIIFSEYYFYLTAYIKNEEFKDRADVINDKVPTIYRIDRIKKIKICDEKFTVPYKDRFEEGEFRKRVQFMFTGELRKVQFTFTGSGIDSILDRLPTAKIISQKGNSYVIRAEAYSIGMDMWLRIQGDKVTDIEYK